MIKLSRAEIDVLYYYLVDSNIKHTSEMKEAYGELVLKIKEERNRKTEAVTPNKIWEALKGVVG